MFSQRPKHSVIRDPLPEISPLHVWRWSVCCLGIMQPSLGCNSYLCPRSLQVGFICHSGSKQLQILAPFSKHLLKKKKKTETKKCLDFLLNRMQKCSAAYYHSPLHPDELMHEALWPLSGKSSSVTYGSNIKDSSGTAHRKHNLPPNSCSIASVNSNWLSKAFRMY